MPRNVLTITVKIVAATDGQTKISRILQRQYRPTTQSSLITVATPLAVAIHTPTNRSAQTASTHPTATASTKNASSSLAANDVPTRVPILTTITLRTATVLDVNGLVE